MQAAVGSMHNDGDVYQLYLLHAT